MKFLFRFISILFVALLFSCNSSTDLNDDFDEVSSGKRAIDFEEVVVKQEIIDKLDLAQDDIGDIQLFRLHLNSDQYEDGLVAVNLGPKAKKDLSNKPNPAVFVDIGYSGNYNYLFVWDGEKRTLSSEYLVSSNALTPLKINVINLMDPGYKNISVEYRMKSGVFEVFYNLVNGILVPIFSYTKIDDMIAEDKTVLNHILVDNPNQIPKDIWIYEAEITNFEREEALKNPNYYDFGELKVKDKKVYEFFYDVQSGKYATFQKPE